MESRDHWDVRDDRLQPFNHDGIGLQAQLDVEMPFGLLNHLIRPFVYIPLNEDMGSVNTRCCTSCQEGEGAAACPMPTEVVKNSHLALVHVHQKKSRESGSCSKHVFRGPWRRLGGKHDER